MILRQREVLRQSSVAPPTPSIMQQIWTSRNMSLQAFLKGIGDTPMPRLPMPTGNGWRERKHKCDHEDEERFAEPPPPGRCRIRLPPHCHGSVFMSHLATAEHPSCSFRKSVWRASSGAFADIPSPLTRHP